VFSTFLECSQMSGADENNLENGVFQITTASRQSCDLPDNVFLNAKKYLTRFQGETSVFEFFLPRVDES